MLNEKFLNSFSIKLNKFYDNRMATLVICELNLIPAMPFTKVRNSFVFLMVSFLFGIGIAEKLPFSGHIVCQVVKKPDRRIS